MVGALTLLPEAQAAGLLPGLSYPLGHSCGACKSARPRGCWELLGPEKGSVQGHRGEGQPLQTALAQGILGYSGAILWGGHLHLDGSWPRAGAGLAPAELRGEACLQV